MKNYDETEEKTKTETDEKKEPGTNTGTTPEGGAQTDVNGKSGTNTESEVKPESNAETGVDGETPTAKNGNEREPERGNPANAAAAPDFKMETQKNSQLTLGHSILHRWFAAGWDSDGKNATTTWTREQVVTEHTRLHRLALVRGLDFSFIPGTIDETMPDDLKKQVMEKMNKSETEAKASNAAPQTGNHTTIIGDIQHSDVTPLTAEGIALSDSSDGEKQFSFILTHAGANRNGDFFTVEELSTRHPTAINKKIDLKHSDEFADIVGGIIASDYVQESDQSWVECVGELYVNDSLNSRLAYKLIKKGVIAQVSMECDFEEGECSICGKRVSNKADYCIHLKNYKGGEFKGQAVYQILHGITFTGLGLLDRKGADENAKIKQVASNEEEQNEGGKNQMAGENKNPDTDAAEAAKKPAGDSGAEKDARIRDLEKENRELKSQLEGVQKELDKLLAEQAAATRRANAEKLVKEMENRGIEFADDDDRENELKRLAALTDDGFAATEAAVKRIKKKEAQADNATQKPEDKNKDQQEQKKPEGSGAAGGMNADAGVKRPADVNDGSEESLEDSLKKGFMTAYEDRTGVKGEK